MPEALKPKVHQDREWKTNSYTDHKNILIVKKTNNLSFERHVILKKEPVSLLALTEIETFDLWLFCIPMYNFLHVTLYCNIQSRAGKQAAWLTSLLHCEYNCPALSIITRLLDPNLSSGFPSPGKLRSGLVLREREESDQTLVQPQAGTVPRTKPGNVKSLGVNGPFARPCCESGRELDETN